MWPDGGLYLQAAVLADDRGFGREKVRAEFGIVIGNLRLNPLDVEILADEMHDARVEAIEEIGELAVYLIQEIRARVAQHNIALEHVQQIHAVNPPLRSC